MEGQNQRMEEMAGNVERLAERVDNLEQSVGRALKEVFPRVEALVSHLEEPSPAVVASKSSACFSSKATAPTKLSTPAQYLAQRELDKELYTAVVNGSVDNVRRLLGEGAEFQKIRSISHCTPLMKAALKGHSDILLVLLENGADVHAIDSDGWTALHCAAQSDLSGKCVVLLIGAGADVNSKKKNGDTPLHTAARFGNDAAVQELLEGGANKKIFNNDNKTALDLAKSDVSRRILQY